MYEKDSLTHHGIKGMRWGKRRYQNPDGSLTPEGKKRYGDLSEEYTKAHTRKSIKSMSNAELRSRNERLRLEQEYSRLSQTRVSAGKKWVTGILVGVATSIATGYATKYGKIGVEYLGGKVAKGVGKAADGIARSLMTGVKFM